MGKAGGCDVLVRSGAKDVLLVGVGSMATVSVEVAASVAAGVGAKVTLLHVLAEPPVAYTPLVERDVEPHALPSRSDALSRLLSGLGARLSDRGVESEVRFRFGPVVDGILRGTQETEADLLVVGTSPAGGEIRRYLLGDLARDFLDDAPCPVLLVRTGTSIWRKVYGDFKGTIGLER